MSWVKGPGGVSRWVGTRPANRPESLKYRLPTLQERRTLTCVDCDAPIHRGSTRCMRHAVEANYPRPRTPHATLGVICECGCLLANAEEACPSCAVARMEVAA